MMQKDTGGIIDNDPHCVIMQITEVLKKKLWIIVLAGISGGLLAYAGTTFRRVKDEESKIVIWYIISCFAV